MGNVFDAAKAADFYEDAFQAKNETQYEKAQQKFCTAVTDALAGGNERQDRQYLAALTQELQEKDLLPKDVIITGLDGDCNLEAQKCSSAPESNAEGRPDVSSESNPEANVRSKEAEDGDTNAGTRHLSAPEAGKVVVADNHAGTQNRGFLTYPDGSKMEVGFDKDGNVSRLYKDGDVLTITESASGQLYITRPGSFDALRSEKIAGPFASVRFDRNAGDLTYTWSNGDRTVQHINGTTDGPELEVRPR